MLVKWPHRRIWFFSSVQPIPMLHIITSTKREQKNLPISPSYFGTIWYDAIPYNFIGNYSQRESWGRPNKYLPIQQKSQYSIYCPWPGPKSKGTVLYSNGMYKNRRLWISQLWWNFIKTHDKEKSAAAFFLQCIQILENNMHCFSDLLLMKKIYTHVLCMYTRFF